MIFVNCPQCRGCKERTANSACRKTCFSFKIAEAKALARKKKRAQIKKAQKAEKIYNAYEADAIQRMQQRDWHRVYIERSRHT